VFGFLFQAAHFLDGLEDQDLIDSGIACLAQPLLGGLNLPAAYRRPGAIAVRNRDIGVAGGIPEIDLTHIARDDPKCELARTPGVFRVPRVNPGA
jgi:hypothetical protein